MAFDEQLMENIQSFRVDWNEMLFRQLSTGVHPPKEEIYRRYPRLLDACTLKRRFGKWESTGSVADREVVGFLLQHQIVYKLIYGPDSPHSAPSSPNLLQLYNASCQELVGKDFWYLIHALNGVRDIEKFRRETFVLLDQTDALYRTYLHQLVGNTSPTLEEVNTSLVNQIYASASRYPPEEVTRYFPQLRASLGLTIPVTLVEPARPCAPLVLWLKQGTTILYKPYGGREDLRALLHAIGHSHHYAATSNRPEFDHLFSIITSESFAFLFQWLTADSLFLQNDTDVQWERFLALHGWRRQAGLYLYHTSVHETWDPDPAAYRAIMDRAVCPDPEDAGELEELDYRLLCMQFLRAFAGTSKLRRHLRTTFGPSWWLSHKAGQYLVSLWKLGNELDVSDLLQEEPAEPTAAWD